MTTIIVFIRYIRRSNHNYWESNLCLNITICEYLVSNYTNICNFHPLEVVDRGSETQLQVGEKLFLELEALKVNGPGIIDERGM